MRPGPCSPPGFRKSISLNSAHSFRSMPDVRSSDKKGSPLQTHSPTPAPYARTHRRSGGLPLQPAALSRLSLGLAVSCRWLAD